MAEKRTAKKQGNREPAARGRGWFDGLPDRRKDLVCVAALLAVVFFMFSQVIFSNLDLATSGADTVAHFSWIRSLDHLKEVEGTDALWMPYIYGGMPIFSSLLFPRSVNYAENAMIFAAKVIFLGSDAHYFLLHVFLSGLFMYLLVRSLKFPHLGALLAAFVFMLNPYAIGLGESFHWSKLAVFSYIPLLFLLFHRLMERRSLLNFGLLAVSIGTMFLNRHPQIAFYAMLLVGSYFLYEFIAGVRKEPKRYLTVGVLLACAVALGMTIYAYELLPTKEYAQFSVRGGGEEGVSGGASYEWATNWSLHPAEMINYIVPSWFGFGSRVPVTWQGQEIVFPGYWGWMPFTDNPPYVGIVPLILAIFALVYNRNRLAWFLVAFSVLVFFISFGKYLSPVYDLFYHYFPYFNKFRAPSLILFLIPFTVGLLGVLGISWIIGTGKRGDAGLRETGVDKKILTWIYVIGGIVVITLIGKQTIFGMFPSSSFLKEGEQFSAQQLPVVREIRFGLLWKDVIKIGVMTVMVLGLVLLFLRRKLQAATMMMGMVAILVVDLVMIDRMFINPSPKTDLEANLEPDATMKHLQSDSTVFRAFGLEQNLFKDNTFMNSQIQSVTGYSPAKLRIYQEMIDSALMHITQKGMPVNMNVLSMMNTKYVVTNGTLPPLDFRQTFSDPATGLITYYYTKALRRAWFADTVFVAESKSAMYAMMNSPDWKPQETAILLERGTAEPVTKPDSNSIEMTTYQSGRIAMDVFTSSRALLVLSEVYYPAGWTATVDGRETPIHRTDAVLRSVVVPAGEHVVEFVFDPQSYRMGSVITNIGWAVIALLLLVGAWRDESVRKLIGKGGG